MRPSTRFAAAEKAENKEQQEAAAAAAELAKRSAGVEEVANAAAQLKRMRTLVPRRTQMVPGLRAAAGRSWSGKMLLAAAQKKLAAGQKRKNKKT